MESVMAETIETFVTKLQQEGVEAGRAEADKIKQEARKQAEQIVDDAQKQAEDIVSQAKKQADELVERSKTELQLAARDTVARLREALTAALQAVLTEAAKSKLEDIDFLGQTLHDIVMSYAKADLQHRSVIRINVSSETRDKLKEWAFKEVGQEVVEQVRPSLDLKGRLKKAGFEYRVDGGTVEVTQDSVVETLCDILTPALRELIDNAVAEQQGET
jgi:V/A-type H+-transporting ATPase subunit E